MLSDRKRARHSRFCCRSIGTVFCALSLALFLLCFSLTTWAGDSVFLTLQSWLPRRCVDRVLFGSLFFTALGLCLRCPPLLQTLFREPAYYDDLETGTWRKWASEHVVSPLRYPKANKHRFLIVQGLVVAGSLTCLAWWIRSQKDSTTSWWQFLGTLGGIASLFSQFCILSGRFLISFFLKVWPPTWTSAQEQKEVH